MENNLVHFKDDDFEIDVSIEKDTVWLTQAQICELFERDRTVITRHINNIFKDGELDRNSVSAKIARTASDGKTYETIHYNLDAIISVGYRVKSGRGIKFRQWATKILNQYLVDGYVLNITRLEKENQKLSELQEMISVVHRVVIEGYKDNVEIRNLLSVVKEYEFALDLLDQYDHKTLKIDGLTERLVKKVTLGEVYQIINTMKSDFTSDLFGKEKDSSLSGSMQNIYQTAFGEDVYPSIEEKATNLLYFLVKNHSFVDGNKRIAAAVFVYFLKKNEVYFNKHGRRRLSDDALVALTLLVAESNPKERDIITKIIINLINKPVNNAVI